MGAGLAIATGLAARGAAAAVVLEAGIFAELASKNLLVEVRFVARIETRELRLFITTDDRGDPAFDSRYNSAVAAAIRAASGSRDVFRTCPRSADPNPRGRRGCRSNVGEAFDHAGGLIIER